MVQRLLREQRHSEAFERLLDRYEQRVFRFAMSIVRNESRAEDVTQDVFLKLWKAGAGATVRRCVYASSDRRIRLESRNETSRPHESARAR